MGQRIAIVGSGISGLAAGYLLSREHQITLFEGNDYLGGHTHTQDVVVDGACYPVNTGFIVFNDWTYPNFIRLMEQLGVESQPSEMSFSVKCARSGLEYSGSNLNALFAQRKNLVNPSFLRMLQDILRFNKETSESLSKGEDFGEMTLGAYLAANRYSRAFIRHYIVPMGAAIWSSGESSMMDFPVGFFLRFFKNHGLLSVNDRPVWRVLKGGSRSYVPSLSAPFKDRIHLNTRIASIRRAPNQVILTTENGQQVEFDEVVIASHSDQALAMLQDATPSERDILGAIPYQDNDVVLHTDTSVLPTSKRAWASWNYHIPVQAQQRVSVTYNMNILQGFSAPTTFCVTLNDIASIRPDKIIASFNYSHPVYTLQGMAAQQRHSEISGHNRTHYCGAYWFNGFHEDGVNSALRIAESKGVSL